MKSLSIVIHTCEHESVSAAVSEFSFRKYMHSECDRLKVSDIRIITLQDDPSWQLCDGKSLTRNGESCTWDIQSPQAHLPLRFTVGALNSDYCLVVDPDVFATKSYIEDLAEELATNHDLYAREVKGGSMCIGHNSAVMIIKPSAFNNWTTENIQKYLFETQDDLQDIIFLKSKRLVSSDIELKGLASKWNDYDNLDADTILLHTTNQKTQPWKTGLKMDGKVIDNQALIEPAAYVRHPSDNVQKFFFALLQEAVEKKFIDEEFIRYSIRRGYIRSDILDIIHSTKP